MTAEEVQKLLEHAGWLRSLALTLADERSEAEDAVQETFLAALRAPPDASRSVRPWLREVLKNVLRQRKRTDRRRANREHATAPPSPGALDAAVEVAAQSELFRGLAREVHMLDEPYRTAIVLRYFEEMSTPEIARRLDVPESTVRSRLERGQKRLRERLDGRYTDRRAWVALLLPLDRSGDAAAPTAAASSGVGAAAGVALVATAASVLLTAIVVFRSGGPEPRGDAVAAASVPREGEGARRRVDDVRAPEREPVAEAPDGPDGFVVSVPIDAVGRSTDGLTAEAVHRDAGRTWVGTGSMVEPGLLRLEYHEVSAGEASDSELLAIVAPASRGGLLIRSAEHALHIEVPFDARPPPARDGAEPAGPDAIRLERGLGVSGRLEHPVRPTAGARLVLFELREWAGFLPPRSAVEVGAVRADGTFDLSVRVPSSVAADERTLILLAHDDDALLGIAKLRLTADDDEPSVVMETSFGDVFVRVEDAATLNGLAGAVVTATPWIDDERSPTRGGVDLRNLRARVPVPGSFEVEVGPDGVARLTALPISAEGGRYHLSASHDSWAPASRSVEPVVGETTSVEIRLVADGGLTVHVVDEAGRPISGATVRSTDGVEAVTDEAGRADVPLASDAADVQLTIEDEEFATARLSVGSAESRRGTSERVVLRPAAPISLIVVDPNDRPIPGLLAALFRGEVQQGASRLDPEASRSVFGTTDAGEYVARLMQVAPTPGEEWVLREPTTVRGGETDRRIVAVRLDRWRGEVVVWPTDLDTGAPLTPVSARLHGVPLREDGLPHRRFVREGVVLLDGAARVEDLPPGEYVLELRFDEGRPATFQSFEVERGAAPQEVRPRIGRGARVELVVDGLPPGATPEVSVRRVPLRAWERVETVDATVEAVPGAPGRFTVRGRLAGAVVLDVRYGDAAAERRLDLPATGLVTATIDLPR